MLQAYKGQQQYTSHLKSEQLLLFAFVAQYGFDLVLFLEWGSWIRVAGNWKVPASAVRYIKM